MSTNTCCALLFGVLSAATVATWYGRLQFREAITVPSPGWAALGASMDTMHRAMAAVEPSGDIDVDFVTLMLPHHQAAIAMAKTQLLYGTNPQLRRLAQEILTDQQSEIELMRLWLQQHHAISLQGE